MRDDAPYPVGVLTDAENLDSSACASRGSAAPRVVAETVDPAVESHEDTSGVDHAYGADIAVPDRILAHSLLVGVFARLFDGGLHRDLAWTLPLNTKDTYKDTLPGLEGGRSIHHSLVAQLGERDKGLHTEDIHKDSGTNHRDDAGFGARTCAYPAVSVSVSGVIQTALCHHCLKPVAHSDVVFGINGFHDIIHLCAEPAGEHLMHYIRSVAAAGIFGRTDGHLSRDGDLIVSVIDDCPGDLFGTRPAFNALNDAGEDTFASLGFKQIQKIAGLEIVKNSSGKKKGRPRISKRGRVRLRRVLYEAAGSLVSWDEAFHEVFLYYRKREKHPLGRIQARVAVACKVIRVFYVILKTGCDYDQEKLRSDIRRPKALEEAA